MVVKDSRETRECADFLNEMSYMRALHCWADGEIARAVSQSEQSGE